MVQRSSRPLGNHLLSCLSEADLAFIAPDLHPVPLGMRLKLEEPNKPIRKVYFPYSGIVSVVAATAHHREIEVGIIGREGMTGINVVMGGDRSPHATFIQVSGEGLLISADHLRVAMHESKTLQSSLLLFAQSFMFQIAHTALANGQATIEQRLARWLLMVHDRLDGDELPVTHEFLAMMLSVRRPGVSVAMRQLQSRGVIDTKRAAIQVKSRPGLKEIANGLYGIPEVEYRRLTGWRAKP